MQLPPSPSKLGCPSRHGGVRRSTRLPSIHMTSLGSLSDTRPPVHTCRTSALAKSQSARNVCSAGVLMLTRLAPSSWQASAASAAVILSLVPSSRYSALRNGVQAAGGRQRCQERVLCLAVGRLSPRGCTAHAAQRTC